MKLAINLLPPDLESEALGKKRGKIVFVSEILLIVILLINVGVFGFYFYLTKSTADTIAAVKREETKITSLAPVEKLYRALSTKISFLNILWQKKFKPEDVVEFSQKLLIPKTTLSKISLTKDGNTSLAFVVEDSDTLELFLNGVLVKEKNGEIASVQVVAPSRTKEGNYSFG